jgi:hypothetical protein
LACKRLFEDTARKYGVREGLNAISRYYPEIFDLFVTMADYARLFPDRDEGYGPRTGQMGTFDSDSDCAKCSTKLGDWSGGRIPTGTFYRSNLVTASVRRDLGNNVYGEVHLGQMPFPLIIAGSSRDPRAKIALAHELAHVATKLYKLPLNHNHVHDLGVFFATEGMPLMKAFERHNANV